MVQVVYEGTPSSFPVQVFNASAPVYWEAGAIAMMDTTGHALVTDGVTNVLGLLADRRNTNVNISFATFLPNNVGNYGDESLFNQPGYGNSLYGTAGGVNSVIPANTIPTTTLLRDETGQNPNTDSRYVTVYTRGGRYKTDQYDTTQVYVPGTNLYADTVNGRVTNQAKTFIVGKVILPVDGNGLLDWQLTLV